MMYLTRIDIPVILLISLHFGVPLMYYLYLKIKWLPKAWNIKKNKKYTPKITIIVPTYNEVELIARKLDNMAMQDYPRSHMHILIIDSASADGTREEIFEWIKSNPDINVRVILENERRGKATALNKALKEVDDDTEIIVITDVDSFWPEKGTLRTVVSYFADPVVGAVSCLKRPLSAGPADIERSYRDYYNVVRLGESKTWSTPIFHGELAAFRKEPLIMIGGFPEHIGADDSHTATKITIMGYRAITPDDIWCEELVPHKDYRKWRVRRAQHLIQHFMSVLKSMPESPKPFRSTLIIESYLHLINPWILSAAIALLVYNAIFMASMVSVLLLVLGIVLFMVHRSFRAWIVTQLYLVLSFIRNLYTREIVWQKEAKLK